MSGERDDGGPAFPIKGYTADASGALCGEVVNAEGLSLRDYFAAKAMAALLNAAWIEPSISTKAWKNCCDKAPPGEEMDFHAWLSDLAYVHADSMLKRRKA